MILNMLYIGIGGFVGANARYIVGNLAGKITKKFPLGTLLVNIIGSFILGVLTLVLREYFHNIPLIKNMLLVGFCGSFTTFSSFSVDTYHLLEKSTIKGFVNILLNVILSIIAFAIGYLLVLIIAIFYLY